MTRGQWLALAIPVTLAALAVSIAIAVAAAALLNLPPWAPWLIGIVLGYQSGGASAAWFIRKYLDAPKN